MIKENGELSVTHIDVANTRYKINNNNPVKVLESICGEITIEKRMLIPMKKTQIGDNPQACILCDIIEIWLSLNYLQCMVVKKIFHYAIVVKGNQCSNKN